MKDKLNKHSNMLEARPTSPESGEQDSKGSEVGTTVLEKSGFTKATQENGKATEHTKAERTNSGTESTASVNSDQAEAYPVVMTVAHTNADMDHTNNNNNITEQMSNSQILNEQNNNLINSNSESFWECGNYRRTVRRVDDGQQACTQLMQMCRERGDIEAAYAKQLKDWSKKWNHNIDKGIDYGTSQSAWRGVLQAADAQADVHYRIKDRLQDEVINTVRIWQKDNYHQKPIVGGLKETREVDDAFKKAQKPWAKLYANVERAKKTFHHACKVERTAVNQDKNAAGDTSVSTDQKKKLTEKVEKCRVDRNKAREAYEQSLQHLNAYNAKYMEDMTMVFEKCQEMDVKRLKFFKEMLFGIHKCVDMANEPRLPQIFADYYTTVSGSDPLADLKYWANKHGTAMTMQWPVFEDFAWDLDDWHETHSNTHEQRLAKYNALAVDQHIPLHGHREGMDEDNAMQIEEYSPELRQISRKAAAKALDSDTVNAGGVLLLRQKAANQHTALPNQTHINTTPTNHRPQSQAVHNGHNGTAHMSTASPQLGSKNGPSMNGNVHRQSAPAIQQHSPISNSASNTSGTGSNPFDDEPSDIERPNEQTMKGVPVRALYDYEAQEDDEMSLVKGESLEKLSEPDEQGWCRGRKHGIEGLYPANYAVPLTDV